MVRWSFVKKILSIIVICSFIIVIIPVKSFADDNEEWIEIRTATDLYNIRNNCKGNYKLMNDIDLSEETAEGGIFDYQYQGWRIIPSFSGIFDGQGFSIIGMRIKEKSDNNYVGFFSSNEGVIKNLNFVNANISVIINNSNSNNKQEKVVGIVAGSNSGTITNVDVSGSIIKDYQKDSGYRKCYIGGITGKNTNIISNCYNCSFVSSNGMRTFISGIAALQGNGRVIECVYNGQYGWTTSASYGTFSGISWSIDSSSDEGMQYIDNCYSLKNYGTSYSSSSSSGYYSNFPIGNETNKCLKIKNSYFIGGTSIYIYNKYGTLLTLNQNQCQDSMFYETFDFDNTWFIDDNYTYKLPMLRNTYNGDIKTEITPEVSIENWTYGDTPNSPGLKGNTGEGLVSYEYKLREADDDAYSETVPTDAGDYTLRASIEETTYYKSAESTCDFTIDQKPLTISGITANNKQYDGNCTANLDCSSAWVSGLVGTDEISVSATGLFVNKNADNDKEVTIDSIELNGEKAGNYKVNAEASQKVTTANITKKRIYVNADNMSKSYGEDDPVFTYTAEGLVNGETADSTATGALGRDNGENVGTYAINQGTLAFGNNYNVSFTGAQFRINKAKGDQTKPNPPVFLSRTETSITVQAVSGYEYSIDGGLFWNGTGIFENLIDNTSYSIVTRKAATQNVEAGVISDALGVRTAAYHSHDYSSNVEIEPSCTDKGVRRYTCECGDNYTEDIPALGHDYGNLIAEVSATCTTAGKKAHYKCARCNKLFVKEGIEYIEKTELELKISSTGHTFDQEVVNDEYLKSAADCTQAAVYYKSCHCGEKGTDTFTSGQKLGHAWNEGVDTKEATCVEAGVKTFTCTRERCNESFTEVIQAKGHDYGDLIVEKPKTCTDDGMKAHYKCARCNKLFIKEGTEYIEKTELELKISSTGHTFDQEVVNDNYVAA